MLSLGRLSLLAVSVLLQLTVCNSGAVQLDSSNIDTVLASNEFVFINFYADWCRFSNMLAPIWDEGADKINTEMAGQSVFVGKVDCDAHAALGTRFHITKYPTIKYLRNGQLAKKEYRGQRSAQAFLEFVQEQTKNPVTEYTELQELNNLEDKAQFIIGYFERKDDVEYENFRKVASNVKDECKFMAGFGETVAKMHPPGHDIVAFRPSKSRSNEDDEAFTGNLRNAEELQAWISEKCNPLVREITFENAEELTEEGLPFLILFHHPDDTDSVKEYNDLVKNELMSERGQINFLTADGVKFAHPLHHLGKAKEDLPLIAVDSFRHMYLFPKYEDSKTEGKVKQFLQDLYSGKLHREFHYGPDTAEEQANKDEDNTVDTGNHIPRDHNVVRRNAGRGGSTDPPESQFKHLRPSDNRYSLLHDEF